LREAIKGIRLGGSTLCICTIALFTCFIVFEANKKKHEFDETENNEFSQSVRGKGIKKTSGGEVEWVYSKAADVFFTRTEITVAQYRTCIGSGNCKSSAKSVEPKRYTLCNINSVRTKDEHPMNCVGIENAISFCEWIGGRLPKPEQWILEFTNGKKWKYPWGDEKPNCERAILELDSNLEEAASEVREFVGLEWGNMNGCGIGSTWPVCSKPKGVSASGLCDMCGNVMEWVLVISEFSEKVEACWVGGGYGSDDCGVYTGYCGSGCGYCGFYGGSRLGGRSGDEGVPQMDGVPLIGFRCVRETIDFRANIHGLLSFFWEKIALLLRNEIDA